MWETEGNAQCVCVCVFGGSQAYESGRAGLRTVSHVELILSLHFEDNLQRVEA